MVLSGAQSAPLLPVISGVPQGSVLEPLLLLVYIVSVSSFVATSNITVYADDKALYKTIHSQLNTTALQEDIIPVCNWTAGNGLKLNFQKYCYVTFSRECHPTSPDVPLILVDSYAYAHACPS